MNINDKVVAELVQTCISVSLNQYKDVYNKQIHPILMAQPGMIAAMAGVITSVSGQDSTQKEDGATVLSLVIWENVHSHIDFVTGPAAGPFFDAALPLMRETPSVEHYEVDGLQPAAFNSIYAQILKASSASDKEFLASIFKRHATIEGSEMALFSDCTEDSSKKALILFGNSEQFEAAGDIMDRGTRIERYNIEWHSRETKSYH